MQLAFLDQPCPIAFAHRGGAAHYPENSWLAFEHAVRLGYTYLETDVRATADGTLIAFHDRTLDRATDRTGTVAVLRYREVTAARVGGTEPIPLVEDLLGAWPGARFNSARRACGRPARRRPLSSVSSAEDVRPSWPGPASPVRPAAWPRLHAARAGNRRTRSGLLVWKLSPGETLPPSPGSGAM